MSYSTGAAVCRRLATRRPGTWITLSLLGGGAVGAQRTVGVRLGRSPGGAPRPAPPPLTSPIGRARLEEVLLLVRQDRAVRRRVRDAGEAVAVAHLVVVEEGAVGLVDRARRHLARARRARARAARVRQVEAVLLGLVEHVGVAGALDLRLAVR